MIPLASGEGEGTAPVAPELQPLLTHLQPPVLAYLLDRHGAGLPAALPEPALQRNPLSWLRFRWQRPCRSAVQPCQQQSGWKQRPSPEAFHHRGRNRGLLQPDQGLVAVEVGLPRFNNPCGAQVPLFSARVLVSLRPSVLDPAGEATRAAAARLGVDGVSRLRIGKAVEVELDAPDAATARQQLELLSDRLLANPVIENWTLELLDDAGAGA